MEFMRSGHGFCYLSISEALHPKLTVDEKQKFMILSTFMSLGRIYMTYMIGKTLDQHPKTAKNNKHKTKKKHNYF